MENVVNYIDIAKDKIKNKKIKVLILGIMAGMFISLASCASTIVISQITNISIARIISGLIFPIGLILVILMKTELFTGNSLLVIPILSKDIKIKELLVNWLIVYIGNFIGSIIISLLIYNTGIYNLISSNIVSIASTKINYSFISAFLLGIMCNFLVCLAVYLSSTVKEVFSKILVIIIPIMLFIILGLEHSVANMYYLSIGYLVNSTEIGISSIFINNLLPVTLGNIIGGTLLGTMIFYLYKKN